MLELFCSLSAPAARDSAALTSSRTNVRSSLKCDELSHHRMELVMPNLRCSTWVVLTGSLYQSVPPALQVAMPVERVLKRIRHGHLIWTNLFGGSKKNSEENSEK
jgi:hypothetical protein